MTRHNEHDRIVAAATAIANGASHPVAARAASVHPKTIGRWLKSSPEFARELARARQARRHEDADPDAIARAYEPLITTSGRS